MHHLIPILSVLPFVFALDVQPVRKLSPLPLEQKGSKANLRFLLRQLPLPLTTPFCRDNGHSHESLDGRIILRSLGRID